MLDSWGGVFRAFNVFVSISLYKGEPLWNNFMYIISDKKIKIYIYIYIYILPRKRVACLIVTGPHAIMT